MRLYKETEKSTFSYWFAHWRAFQMTALKLHCWRPRFLFHDIEKPFLMAIWKDYPRVKAFHRSHARHHLAYKGKRGYDYLAMVIDWECSRFTKEAAPLNARETLQMEAIWHPTYYPMLVENITPILDKLGL